MVLGDAQLALGEADAAREAFAQAALNADLYLEPLRRLASLAENEGDFEQCLEYLDRLDQLSPLNIDRKIDMGRINLELGNDVKAERLFGSALEQVSRDAMGQVGNLAERIAAVYSERDPGKAESFLRRALNAKRNYLTRDDLRLFNQLGVNLRRQGKWRDAVAEYRRALAIAADEVTIHYNMGMAYSEGGMHRDAKLCMDKALSLDEKLALVSPNVACNLGMVYLRGGLRDRARRFFEDALDQNPDMERAHKALESM
jgi:tetratricopeptide (TPR) repeat protein